MTKLKTIIVAVVAVVAVAAVAGAFAVGGQARTAHHPPRHGALHATKECVERDNKGQAGGFCTILSSNLPAIRAGSRVFYLEAAGATGLDSDLVLYAGPGNAALGHVTLSFASLSGSVILKGGTGQFRGFRARVLVTFDKETNLWHWDGTYRFGRS